MTSRPNPADTGGSVASMVKESIRLYREPLIYLSIAAWAFRRQLRELMPRIVPIALIVLAALEAFGPLFHVFPLESLAASARVLISSALTFCAFVTVASYHQQRRQIARQSVFLSSVGVLIEQKESGFDPDSERQQIVRVLEMLTTSLRYDREHVNLEAALLTSDEDRFRVYCQFPASTVAADVIFNKYSGFPAEVNRESEGDVLYVPYVAFGHGLKISRDGSTRFIPSVIALERSLELPSRSLLATKIETGEHATSPHEDAILVLTASRTDFMRNLDFQAVRIAAILIADILRSPDHRSDYRLWDRIRMKSGLRS
jgi:hypothetical protein